MTSFLFAVLWMTVLIVPQMTIRFFVFGMSFGPGFAALLVIYAGFAMKLTPGFLSVLFIGFTVETFSGVPHGYFIVSNAILFIIIRLVVDRILTEAYLTKSLWVFLFSFVDQCVNGFVTGYRGVVMTGWVFWAGAFFQSFISAVISLPLFMVLDRSMAGWMNIFTRRKGHLTGADLYQAKSPQRKYF